VIVRKPDGAGSSPYATGRGGVLLEHEYAASVLGSLLLGQAVGGLGDEFLPTQVALQQEVFAAVDDVVIRGTSPGGNRTLLVACRRRPTLGRSSEATVLLFSDFLQVVVDKPDSLASGELRLGLAVSGPFRPASELADLTEIARRQPDSAMFHAAVAVPGAFSATVRRRLTHVHELVETARGKLGPDSEAADDVNELSWALLRSLYVIQLQLEGDVAPERTQLVARLQTVTGDMVRAEQLRRCLVEIAGQAAIRAGVLTESMLRHELYASGLLDGSSDGVVALPAGESVRNQMFGVVDGQAVQVGVVHGDLNVGGPVVSQFSPADGYCGPLEVRSGYLARVQGLAPPQLLNRQTELDLLAEFCRDAAHDRDYWWWQAPSWSGKTSVMLWFVLHPPEGVRVASFIITSRMTAQNDSSAFAKNLLEQLLVIAQQSPPPMLDPATIDGHLLRLFDDASRVCRERGEKLVIVVDGLDEDRGVTTGPDAHSIAALLPVVPPSGMRVIVAGRPRPGIPGDVPEQHPLRNPDCVRVLAPSPHARTREQELTRELKYLLNGDQIEQDLVGLVAAANGGLTEADLADLGGWTVRRVLDVLNTVTGRSFERRATRWSGTNAYVLCHEGLHGLVLESLGAARVGDYRQRLHAWADRYRQSGWPEDTPEYLLVGYLDVLSASNDQDRLVMYATDVPRHDRLLRRSGSDYVALTQNARARQVLFNNPHPDWRSLIRLVLHQSHLAGRARNIPAGLPGVWARLGRTEHAENLAQVLPDPYLRVVAMASMGEMRADNGDVHGVEHLLDRAQSLLSAVTRDDLRDAVLVPLVWAAARVGHAARADELIAQVTSIEQRVRATVVAARAALATDDPDQAREWSIRAEATVHELPDPAQQAQALTWIAETRATLGDSEQARQLLNNAMLRAQAIVEAGPQAASLISVATVATTTGLLDPAGVFRAAQLLADASDDPTRPAALAILAAAAVPHDGHEHAVDLLDKAEELAQGIHDHYGQRVAALTKVAESAVILGDVSRAQRLALEIGHTHDQEQALVLLAACAARNGDPHSADRLARLINTPARRAEALIGVAWSWIDADEPHRAQAVLEEIEDQARAMTDFGHAPELASIATSEAAEGRYDRARTIAELISDEHRRTSTLSAIARTAAIDGQADRARQLFEIAEQFARDITYPWPRAIAVQTVASAAWAAADLDKARRLYDDAEGLARTLDKVEIKSTR
jgi:tetratricopeptide (TPR) repeat protein